MNGNGCAGSIASGVSTGKICSRNSRVEPCAVGIGEFVGARCTAMPASRSSARIGVQIACWSAISVAGASRRRARAAAPASARPRCGVATPAVDHAFEAGDAHHVELVEVGGRDRQEAQPLQQRMARVLRLLQHAPVEGEPGQLAVDEPLGRRRVDGGARGRGSGGRAVELPCSPAVIFTFDIN